MAQLRTKGAGHWRVLLSVAAPWVVATLISLAALRVSAAVGVQFRLTSSAYYVAASPQSPSQVTGLGNVQGMEVGFDLGESFAMGFAQETGTLGAALSGQASTFAASMARFRLMPVGSPVGLAVGLGSCVVSGPFSGYAPIG